MKKLYSTMIVVALVLNLFAFVTVGGSATSIEENKIINHLEELSAEQLAELTSEEDSYYISVFIEFDYPEMDRSTLQNLDRPARNDEIEAYYRPRNLAIAQELGVSADTVSSYAPFAELQYSTVAEYEAQEEFIYSLADSEDIEDIEIEIFITRDESTRAEEDGSVVLYSKTRAYNDIGIVTNSYNGEGIKVGIIESTIPENATHIPEGKLFYPEGYATTGGERTHADYTTAVLGGTSGVASDVSFFASPITTSTGKNSIEWLIDQNVDIINVSWCVYALVGYNNFCAYVDYITDVTGCLFICSAGNAGEYLFDTNTSNDIYYDVLGTPSIGANCISVGATDYYKQVPYFSSSSTPTVGLLKPDLVAPGRKLEIFSSIWKSGTSFSAPLVTGIAARLLDEFPTLLTKPYLLKAVLLASCVPLPDQVNEHDEYAGAGLVNYTRARTIMQQGTYGYFEKMPDLSNGEFLTSFEINKTAGSTVNIHFAQQIPGVYSANPTFTVATLLFTKFSYTTTEFPSGDYIYWENETNTGNIPLPNNGISTSYYIDVYIEDNALPDDYETVAYAYTLEPSS